MKISIFLKDVAKSENVQEIIEHKSKRLEKFLDAKTNLKWSCTAKQGNYSTEVSIIGPHFVYHAHAEAFEVVESIDKSLAKIEKQLNKKLDKWKSRRKEIKAKDLQILDPEEAWIDYDEDSFDDAL